jgi:hypothetical protein
MNKIVSTCVQTLVRFKFLPCYKVGYEPEPSEPHQNFHPEPHKNDAAPQHCPLHYTYITQFRHKQTNNFMIPTQGTGT